MSAFDWPPMSLLAVIAAGAFVAVGSVVGQTHSSCATLTAAMVAALPVGSVIAAGLVIVDAGRWYWLAQPSYLCGLTALAIAGACPRWCTASVASLTPGTRRLRGWGQLACWLQAGPWLIVLGLGAPVLPTALDVIRSGWLVPVWVGWTLTTPVASALGRRRKPPAVLCAGGLLTGAGFLLLVLAPAHPPGWGTAASAVLGAGIGTSLTATPLDDDQRRPLSWQAGAVMALSGARMLAGVLAITGAGGFLDHLVLAGHGSARTSMVVGAVGAVVLVAVRPLRQQHFVVHDSDSRAAVPGRAVARIFHPRTAEDEAATLRRALIDVRNELARLHDELSIALAQAQAASQEPLDRQAATAPFPTGNSHDRLF